MFDPTNALVEQFREAIRDLSDAEIEYGLALSRLEEARERKQRALERLESNEIVMHLEAKPDEDE